MQSKEQKLRVESWALSRHRIISSASGAASSAESRHDAVERHSVVSAESGERETRKMIGWSCLVLHFREKMHHRVAQVLSVLQCVAVCCSVLQCVAVSCSELQCVAVCCSVLQCVAVCCSVLQCVAVCCSVLQCVAVCCSVFLPREDASSLSTLDRHRIISPAESRER